MASKKFLTLILDGAKFKNKQFDSHTEVVDFLGVRVGADQLPISELSTTSFGFGGKRLGDIADGVSGYDAVSKSQMDTALSGKVNTSAVGAASGICPLDSNSKVASTYLPSYVDDVIEAADLTAIQALTGEAGKIYVALDTGKCYRWSGSAFVEISASPGSTDAVTEGSTNLYFTEARVRATVLTGLSAASGGTVAATDSILVAVGKLENRVALNDAKVSYSASTARGDLIASSISDGDTTHAPDGNSVFDALAGKSDTGHGHSSANISDFAAAAKTAAVVNSTAGSQTDQAASVSAMKSYVAGQIGSAVSKSFLNMEGAEITVRQFVYESAAGEVQLAAATDNIGSDDMIGCVKDAAIAGDNLSSGEIYLPARGVVIGGFSGLSVNAPLYLSRTVPGSYQQNLTGFVSGNQVIRLGLAISATEIVFEPAHVMEY